MDDINRLIQPELLVMVPVLNFMASALKKRDDFSNTKIPVTLGGAGVFLAVCYELASVPVTGLQSVFEIIFTGVTQGLLCAAGAVYLHQLRHQKEKEDGRHSETHRDTENSLDGGKQAPCPAEKTAKNAAAKKPVESGDVRSTEKNTRPDTKPDARADARADRKPDRRG